MNKIILILIVLVCSDRALAKFRNLVWSQPTSVAVSNGQISLDVHIEWAGDDDSWANTETVPGRIQILDSGSKVVASLQVSYGGTMDVVSQGFFRVKQSSFTSGHVSKMGDFRGTWLISLSNGPYLIEGYSGISDGLPINAAGVSTNSLFVTESANSPAINPSVNVDIHQTAMSVAANISPSIQTIVSGSVASLALSSSGGSIKGNILTGTDGLNLINPASIVSVKPSIGSYTYELHVSGVVRLNWFSQNLDELWLDSPNGPSTNILNATFVDVSDGGLYTIRARTGKDWNTQLIQVISPNQAVSTATLIVVAAPANPVVDNPPVAPPTANPQANPPVDPPVSNPPINPVANAAIGPIVTAFSPTVSNYTVTSGLAAGKTYGRCWQNGGVWTAYLGREGVGFQATASSDQAAITAFEIQAKSPSSDWYTLTRATPPAGPSNRTGLPVTQSLSARLGEVNAQKPLIPADETLAGEWRIRARAQDSLGTWSPWAFEQSLTATLPIAVVTKTGQTLPPVEDAAWFTASPAKTYTFNVLVP